MSAALAWDIGKPSCVKPLAQERSVAGVVRANREVDRRELSHPHSSALDVWASKKFDKVAEWVKDVESAGIFLAADLGAKRSLGVCPVVGFGADK